VKKSGAKVYRQHRLRCRASQRRGNCGRSGNTKEKRKREIYKRLLYEDTNDLAALEESTSIEGENWWKTFRFGYTRSV